MHKGAVYVNGPQGSQIVARGLTGYPLAGDGHGRVRAPKGANEHMQTVRRHGVCLDTV